LKPFDRTLDLLEREAAALYTPPTVTVGEEATPLDFLYAVFRNNELPLSMRMKAAEAVAQYTHPKLAAILSASVSGEEFGDRLERARQRIVEGIPPRALNGPVYEPKPLPRRGLPKP